MLAVRSKNGNTSQLFKCCVWWVSVALAVVCDSDWRQENPGSVLSGTTLCLGSTRFSVVSLLGLKQLVFEDAGSFTSFAPYIVDCVMSVDHRNKLALTHTSLYLT